MKLYLLSLVALTCTSLSAHDPSAWKYVQFSTRQLNTVQIIDANTIIAAGGNESNDRIMFIARSTDGGDTWGMITDSFDVPWLKSVDFVNSLTGYAVGYEGRIIKTNDGGQSWVRQPVTGNAATRNFNSVFFINEQLGFAVGGNETNDSIQTILKTTDGGDNWGIMRDQPGNWLRSVYFIDADTGYTAGDDGVLLKTTDGGANWNEIVIPGGAGTRNFNSVYFINGTTGFLGGGNKTNDSIQTILKTTDAGNSWSVITDNISPWIKAICFATATTGFATGDYGTLLLTEDAGDTWNQVAVPDSVNDTIRALNAVHFLNADFGVAVGALGKILVYRPSAPTTALVETGYATDIGYTSATLNARVNANGNTTSVTFEYGTTSAFGNSITANPSTVSGSAFTTVTASLSGLNDHALYYFRVVAQNSNGTVFSDTRQFYTGGNPIPNFDFEVWDSLIRNVPSQWLSIGNFSETTSYDGSSAILLQGDSTFPFAAVLYGFPGDNNLTGGTPFAARPDSLIGHFKYNIPSTDSALVLLMFKKNGVFNSQLFYYLTGSSGGSFQRHAFPISYSNSDVPDTLIIAFVSSDPFTGNPQLGGTVEIDNISFAGTSVNVPNADFESWEERIFEMPEHWRTDQTDAGNAFKTTVTKTTDSQHGDFAARLQNDVDILRLSRISTTDGSHPAFPVNNRHQTLNGYFKYFPESGDSLRIVVEMYQDTQRVGNAEFHVDSTVSTYTPFSIPIDYSFFSGTPDGANIIIHASTDDPPLGNSILYIDNIGFDGFYTGVTNPLSVQRSTLQWKVYPNPARGNITLAGSSEKNENVILSVVDMQGKILREQPLQLPAGSFQVPVDLSRIPGGAYIISLQSKGAISWKRVILAGDN